MRLVVDTNILISALFAGVSLPSHLVALWQHGAFELLTCADQIDEVMRVTRYPKLHGRIAPALAGRFINELRDIAVLVQDLPKITVCADPHDNYLLALASKGAADFLVTGDKRDVLTLGTYQGIRIITVRDFLTLTKRLP